MLSILRQRLAKYSVLSYLKLIRKKPDAELGQFYFGYGANLNPDRFKKFNMRAICIGKAVLNNYDIVFDMPCEYLGKGYASVTPSSGAQVWGMLYRMDRVSLLMLDILEWALFGAYKRKLHIVQAESGEEFQAWVYETASPRSGLKPSKSYLQNMIAAASKAAFPTAYIEKLQAHEVGEKFPLDLAFSLLRYGKTRPLATRLAPFYQLHDKWRERLSEWI